MRGSRRNKLVSLPMALALLAGCASQISPPTAVISGGAASDGGTNVMNVFTGALVTLDGSSSADPQSLTLTYLWTLKALPPASASKLNADNVVSPTFTPDVSGAYTVTLVVSDGVYSSATAILSVIAGPCGGYGPEIATLDFTQGPIVQTTSFTVTTADGGAADAGAVDAGPVDAGPVDAGPVDGGAVDGGHPDAGPVDAGHVDGGSSDAGASDGGAFDAGSTLSGNPNFIEVAPIQLSATISDPDTSPASCPLDFVPAIYAYTWTLQAPTNSTAALSNAASASPSFSPDLPGTYTVALQVTDPNHNKSPWQSSTITVLQCGEHNPVVTLTGATAKVSVGTTGSAGTGTPAINTPLTLTAAVSDLDNVESCDPSGAFTQQLAADWTLVSLPNGSHASLTTTPVTAQLSSTATLNPDVYGTYVVRLGAVDSTGRSATPSIVSIVVPGCTGDNTPSVTAITGFNSAGTKLPAGASGGQTGSVGEAVSFQATVTDADNTGCTQAQQTFTYAWSIAGLPTGSFASLNNGSLASPSLTLDVAGTYTIQVVATDMTGLSSLPFSESITVASTSSSCGTLPPTLTKTANLPTPIPMQLNHVSQVQVNESAALLTLLQPSTNANPTCTGPFCNVLFTVDDPNAEGTNGCTPISSLAFGWSFVSLPSGSQAAFLNPTVQNPSFTPDQPGTYVVQVTATDSRGFSASATWELGATAAGSNPPVVQFNSGLTNLTFQPGSPATVSGAQVGKTVDLNLGGCANNNNSPQLTDADNTGSTCNDNFGPDTFTFAWTLEQAPTGSVAQLVNASSISAAFVPDVEGTYELAVVVAASNGTSSAPAHVNVDVTIAPCGANIVPQLAGIGVTPAGNAAVGLPVQISIPPPTNLNGNNVYNNTIGGVQVCSTPETFAYFWSFTSLPAGSQASINDPTSPTAGFTPDVASGTWGLEVTVSDQQGRSASTTINVTSSACGDAAPVVSIGAADCGATGSTPPAVCTAAPQNAASGAAPYACAQGQQSGVSCLTAASRVRVNTDTWLLGSLTASANFACQPSDTWASMTYGWTLVSAPAASAGGAFSDTTTAGATFTPDVAGTYVLSLTVSNIDGRSASSSITLVNP